MLGWFFNHTVTLKAVQYPRDASGGEVPTPRTVAVVVACCVQQDASGGQTEGQGRRGSSSDVTVFFRPAAPPQVDAVEALKVNDRIEVMSLRGKTQTIVLNDGAFDAAGRGVVWEARGRDVK